ncbi:Cof-type HAD-IIB family hydrolase [Bacillota bacterium Meth-B3]
MAYKIVFSDIDGTLLDSAHRVSDRLRAVVARIKARGVEFVLASARPPDGMREIRDRVGASETMICYGGAVICDDERVYYSDRLPIEHVRAVWAAVEGKGINVNFYQNLDWYVEAEDRWSRQEGEIVRMTPTVTPIGPLLDDWMARGLSANKLLLIASAEEMRRVAPAVERAAGDAAVVSFSKDNYLEVVPRATDKAKAARFYCELRGIEREAVVAAGDQDQDLPLLRFAGFGIGMANGSAEVRAQADVLARSNDEDGLALSLEALFRL